MPPSPPSLSPQKAAALLQHIFDAVPTWEYGVMGRYNSLRLAEVALAAGGEAAQQGAFITLLAWQRHPLDVRLARMTHALFSHSPCRSLAGALASWCAVPEGGATDAQQLAHAEESDILGLLKRMLPDPEHGGFWLAQGLRWCRERPHAGDTCRQILHMAAKAAPTSFEVNHSQLWPELWSRLWAQWAQLHLPTTETLAACSVPMPAFQLWQNLSLAHILATQGQREEAVRLLQQVWKLCPCHPNLILSLYDLQNPLPTPPPASLAPSTGRDALPALALYSWNKANILRQTLHSLRDTEGVHAPLYVLDNGSTDGTADMLRAFGDDWPGQAPHIITLPVNIGAPAARNWLLSLPEIRERGSVVFLDDDLLLDAGWLDTLRAAALAYPHAAVLGSRIVDHTLPHRLQCADFFLLPSDQGQRSFMDVEEHIFLHCNSMGSTDTLLTAYTRPCLSVSGCCHWLRLNNTGTMHRDGHSFAGFDVRFSPSQFDDVERDMRLALAGQEVVYVGQCRTRHVQHSSLRQSATRARSAHIFGNKIKLEFLHDSAATSKALHASTQRARQDLLRKMTRLHTGATA